ncbi:MAG: ferredoxin, partial [Deltaproteobacteria bacterium]|nr:ferredoxin [Deltaproteobacteria bacterium]
KARRPAVFSLHCPCPPEHGPADDAANRASRLALESRAVPVLVYDPGAGESLAECLNLDGNPSIDETWPAYELKYRDAEGAEQAMTLPLTVADWAATETRFKKHFTPIAPDAPDEDLMLFHEYLALEPEEREGREPYIYTLDRERRLARFAVSPEIAELAEDRLRLWHQLRQMAGLEVSGTVRDRVAAEIEAEFEQKAEAVRADYERRMADLKVRYPQVIARRLAEGLLRGNGSRTVSEILAEVGTSPLPPLTIEPLEPARPAEPLAKTAPAPEPAPAQESPAAPATGGAAVAADEPLVIEPYIDSARCTTCDECTNLNRKLFAYDEKKQAYIKDPKAGTFKDLVIGAERCPVGIIHPGTPLNPKEKGLDKLIERAARFN